MKNLFTAILVLFAGHQASAETVCADLAKDFSIIESRQVEVGSSLVATLGTPYTNIFRETLGKLKTAKDATREELKANSCAEELSEVEFGCEAQNEAYGEAKSEHIAAIYRVATQPNTGHLHQFQFTKRQQAVLLGEVLGCALR